MHVLAAYMPEFAGAALQLGKSRWLDMDRGIVTSTPKLHAAIVKAINQNQKSEF